MKLLVAVNQSQPSVCACTEGDDDEDKDKDKNDDDDRRSVTSDNVCSACGCNDGDHRTVECPEDRDGEGCGVNVQWCDDCQLYCFPCPMASEHDA